MNDLEFSRAELAGIREDARRLGVRLPRGMTAMRMGGSVRPQYLVESRDGLHAEVSAGNAYDARVKVIERLLKSEGEQ